jgi:hypothetical protein
MHFCVFLCFSAKRKEEYKEFLEFTDTEPLKIIKHCSTRWLSLQKCVGRFLHHWPALTSYFMSHRDVEKPGRVKRSAELLSDTKMRLTYLFLDYVLVPLNEFNTTFQADESMVGYLMVEMKRLLKKFLAKFVLNAVITSSELDLTKVDFRPTVNQQLDKNLAVGMKTRAVLMDKDNEVPPEIVASFFRYVTIN